MYCRGCGEQLVDETGFCNQCGRPATDTPAASGTPGAPALNVNSPPSPAAPPQEVEAKRELTGPMQALLIIVLIIAGVILAEMFMGATGGGSSNGLILPITDVMV